MNRRICNLTFSHNPAVRRMAQVIHKNNVVKFIREKEDVHFNYQNPLMFEAKEKWSVKKLLAIEIINPLRHFIP